MSLGERIRAAREQKGLSLRKLASRVGMQHMSLWEIETLGVDPRCSTLVAIAQALGCTPNDLLLDPAQGALPLRAPRARTRRATGARA